MTSALWGLVLLAGVAYGQAISTVAGNTTWAKAHDVTVDGNGNIFVADSEDHVVYKTSPQGATTIVAGTRGSSGLSGDGGQATLARLYGPTSVAVASDGTLYIADRYNNRIRKISSAGIISTFAGTNSYGFGGDGGPATSALLYSPYDLALDPQGNLLVTDYENNRIRRISTDGLIATVAGTGTRGASGNGGPALLAAMQPARLTLAADGSIYFTDGDNYRIRRISPTGVITGVGGTGVNQNTGDRGQSTLAAIASPNGIAIDASGNIYISSFSGDIVRRIAPDGVVTTIAGTGSGGYSGDGGAATAARLSGPLGLEIDLQGNLLIADYYNARIRKVILNRGSPGSPFGTNVAPPSYPVGTISTVGGNTTWGKAHDVTVDGSGNIFVPDSENNVVLKTDPQGVTTIVAGTRGSSGFSGDGGQATLAKLYGPTSVAVAADGTLYIADRHNNRIRKVNPAGIISTFAGRSTYGFGGDGGPATNAPLYNPYDLVLDAEGNLLFTDYENNRIRRISPSGLIATVAGSGARGSSGNGGSALLAAMQPERLALAADGSIYFSDGANHRVRRISPAGVVTAIGGTGASQSNGDGGPATSAAIAGPNGMAIDQAGNIYVASFSADSVRRIAPDGVITTIAGTGSGGYSGDQGPAAAARLSGPLGLEIDPQGNLLIADYYNARVRRVLLAAGSSGLPFGTSTAPPTFPAGTISTVAGNTTWANANDVAVDANGNIFVPDSESHVVYKTDQQGLTTIVAGTRGSAGFSGDGGQATLSKLYGPTSVAVASDGTLYIADRSNNRIRKVTPGGIISTFAGTGSSGFGGDGGAAISAPLYSPYDVVLDSQGSLLIADYENNRIRKVSAAGLITTLAGSGSNGSSGNGGPALVAAMRPTRLTLASDGSVYFSEGDYHRVRRISPNGIVTTIGGTGESQASGDGGQAISAGIVMPYGVAIDRTGNIYVASFSRDSVRRIAPDGVITTVAGSGAGYSGDQGPATEARLNGPIALEIDPEGNLLVADYYNARIRKILLDGGSPGLPFGVNTPPPSFPAGTISTVAGNTTWAKAHDVTVDSNGNIFVADSESHVVYKTDPQGVSTIVAGTRGSSGFSGDGQQATLAKLYGPSSVSVAADGTLYIADRYNNRIRKVSPEGLISTLAGAGTGGFRGDGGAAASAWLNNPYDVAVDSLNNVLVSDFENNRIRRISAAGVISTIAGNGTRGFSGDGGSALNAALQPARITLAPDGSVYFTHDANHRVRRIAPNGTISTIGGTGVNQSNGDGGQATSAAIATPNGIAIDSSGNVYASAFSSDTVRRIAPDGIITTIAGTGSGGYSGDQGPAIGARLSGPMGLEIDPQGNLLIADYYNARVRRVLLNTSQSGRASFGTFVPISVSQASPVSTLSFPGTPGDVITISVAELPPTAATLCFAVRAPGDRVVSAARERSDSSAVAVLRTAVSGMYSVTISECSQSAPLAARVLVTCAGQCSSVPGPQPTAPTQVSQAQQLSGGATVSNHLLIGTSHYYQVQAAIGTIVQVVASELDPDTAGILCLQFVRQSGGEQLACNGKETRLQWTATSTAPETFAVFEDKQDDYLSYSLGVVSQAVNSLGISTSPISVQTSALKGQEPIRQLIKVEGPVGLAFRVTPPSVGWLEAVVVSGTVPGSISLTLHPETAPTGASQTEVRLQTTQGATLLSIPISFNVSDPQVGTFELDTTRLQIVLPTIGPNQIPAGFGVKNTGGTELSLTVRRKGNSSWLSIVDQDLKVSKGQSVQIRMNIQRPPGAVVSLADAVTVSASGAGEADLPVIVTSGNGRPIVAKEGITLFAPTGADRLPRDRKDVEIWNPGAIDINPNVRRDSKLFLIDVNGISGKIKPNEVRTVTVGTLEAVDSLKPRENHKAMVWVSSIEDPTEIPIEINVARVGSMPPRVNTAGVILGTPNREMTTIEIQPTEQRPRDVGLTAPCWLHVSTTPNGPSVSRVTLPGTTGDLLPPTRLFLSFKPASTGCPISGNDNSLTLTYDGLRLEDAKRDRSETVTIVVPQEKTTGTPNAIMRDADGNCVATKLYSVFSQPSNLFSATTGVLLPVEAQVFDNCGSAPENLIVRVIFSSSDPSISLTKWPDGIWRGTWIPVDATGSQTSLKLSVNSPTLATQTSIFGAVQPGEPRPAVAKKGLVNAAGLQPLEDSVAPGQIVTLFGIRLARTIVNAGSKPLDELGGTSVRLGSVRLPLFYVSPNQINALIPFEFPPDQLQFLTIENEDGISVPLPVLTANAKPGIFMLSEKRGAIVGPSGHVVGANGEPFDSTPGHRGETIVVYATGFGAVSPKVSTASPAPSTAPLPEVVGRVTASIGGVTAKVAFKGLAPTFFGLNQLNIEIPPSAPTGNAVPLVISVDGVATNSAFLAIE